MTVMVVDPNASVRELIKSLLRVTSTEVVELADGTAMLRQYSTCHPDWVLLDSQLPGDASFSASRDLKNAYPDARVALLTTHDSEAFRRSALANGVGTVILKDDLYTELISRRTLACDPTECTCNGRG